MLWGGGNQRYSRNYEREENMNGNDYGYDLEFVVTVLVVSACLLGVTLALEFFSEWRSK